MTQNDALDALIGKPIEFMHCLGMLSIDINKEYMAVCDEGDKYMAFQVEAAKDEDVKIFASYSKGTELKELNNTATFNCFMLIASDKMFEIRKSEVKDESHPIQN